MNFWKTYICSFWFFGVLCLVSLILLGTHNYGSFNITVGMVSSFFSAVLAFSLMSAWQNQARFSKIYFVAIHLLASLIFFLFFKNHFQNYVLEDSGLYFFFPLVGIFVLTFLVSGFGAINKNENYLWKRNANIASSFGNAVFFALLVSIGVLLVSFSIDLLFWNNIVAGGFGVKIYLSIFSLVFFSIFGYTFLKNETIKQNELNFFSSKNQEFWKTYDTNQFLKLYFPIILIFLVLLAVSILLMIQKGLQPGIGIFVVVYLSLWIGYYLMDFPGKSKLNFVFWLIAIGLGGFLIYATKTRIDYHGRSIARYGAILLGGFSIIAGLSQICFKSLKIFIVLVFVTLFFGFFSPLNGLKISQQDQIERIEKILVREGILVDGNLVEPKKTLSNEKRADLLLRLQNYIYNYGSKGLLPWLKNGNASLVGDAINDFSDITGIKRGFESYKNPDEKQVSVSRPYDSFKTYEFDSSDFWSVQGYESAFRFKANLTNNVIKYNQNSIRLLGNGIRIFYNQKIYNLDLSGFLNSISQVKDENNIIPSYSLAVGDYYFTIVFSNLQINTNQNIIDELDAMVFVKKI